MSDADRAASLLRQVLGLPPTVVPMSDTWARFQWEAQFQRVVPLLYHLVRNHEHGLDEEQRRQLRSLQGNAMVWAVRLEHHLLSVASLLAKAGIEFAVLKGIATAHLDYPDPSWRQFGDIDLLVSPEDFSEAHRAVLDAGWTQEYALPRHHERFTHAMTFMRGNVELDLHQRIGHRSLGLLVPTPSLLEHREPFEIAGTEVWALSPIDRLIHAAIHAVTSRGSTRRLSSVADVILMADHHEDSAPEVLERAERWRVRPIVERAVNDAYRLARTDVPQAWITAMRAPIQHLDRLVDRAYLDDRRHPIVEELAYLRLLDRWADRASYVSGHLLPDVAFSRQHGRISVGGHVRYLWSKIRARS